MVSKNIFLETNGAISGLNIFESQTPRLKPFLGVKSRVVIQKVSVQPHYATAALTSSVMFWPWAHHGPIKMQHCFDHMNMQTSPFSPMVLSPFESLKVYSYTYLSTTQSMTIVWYYNYMLEMFHFHKSFITSHWQW